MGAVDGGKANRKPRRAEDVAMQLVVAFDTAHQAFEYQRVPGWAKASADLRDALDDAREIGDVSKLPCPLAWWTTCQASARAWLEAPEDVRRGLSRAAKANMGALLGYLNCTIAVPEPKLPRGEQ